MTSVWVVHEVGKLLFPIDAYRQMYGVIAQDIGFGLLKDFAFDQDYPWDANYDTHLILTALAVPETQVYFVQMSWDDGLFGDRNLAEPVMIPTIPLLLNAVAHATWGGLCGVIATLERVLLGRQLQNVPADDGMCTHWSETDFLIGELLCNTYSKHRNS